MKNKIIKILIPAILFLSLSVRAQFFQNLGDRLNEKVNNRVNQKADEAIDKGLDKTEQSLGGGGYNESSDQQSERDFENQIALNGSHGDCGNYYLLINHSLVQMTVYDKNNKPALTLNYHVKNVKPINNGKEADVQIEAFDEKGNKMSTASAVYKCINGTLLMDMKASMPYNEDQQGQMNAQGKEQNAFLQYPPNMKVGQTLPDVSYTMDMQQQNSIIASAKLSATKRKVEDREEVSTPAGTWNCFRISYIAKTQVAFMSFRYYVTEWFAPDFGIVKSLSKNKKGKIMGRTELTKVQ